MKLWRYTSGPAIAYGVTFILALLVLIITRCKCPHKLVGLRKRIVLSVFPGILREQRVENGSKKLLFSDADITYQNDGVIATMTTISLLSLTIASLIFWQTLMLEVSYDCEVEDKTKECFPYDFKKQSGAFSMLKLDPVNCSSPEIVNGTVTVICYQFVFNIGFASGASFGVLRLISTVLGLMAGQVMLHSKIVVNIIKCISVFFWAAILGVSLYFMIKWKDVFTKYPELVKLDSGKLVTALQILFTAFAALVFVFSINWKELIEMRANQDVTFADKATQTLQTTAHNTT